MVQRDLFAKPQAHQAAEINKGQEKKVSPVGNQVCYCQTCDTVKRFSPNSKP